MFSSLTIGIEHPQFVFKSIFYKFMTHYGGHFKIHLVVIVTRFFSKKLSILHLHYIWHQKPLVEKKIVHFDNPTFILLRQGRGRLGLHPMVFFKLKIQVLLIFTYRLFFTPPLPSLTRRNSQKKYRISKSKDIFDIYLKCAIWQFHSYVGENIIYIE